MKVEFKKGEQVTEDLLTICSLLGKSPTATLYHLVREYNKQQAQNEDASVYDKTNNRTPNSNLL